MSEDKLEKAQAAWQEQAVGREVVQDGCSIKEVENESVWIERGLTYILNSYTTPLSVTACFKR